MISGLSFLFHQWLCNKIAAGKFKKGHIEKAAAYPMLSLDMLRSFLANSPPLDPSSVSREVSQICNQILEDDQIWELAEAKKIEETPFMLKGEE